MSVTAAFLRDALMRQRQYDGAMHARHASGTDQNEKAQRTSQVIFGERQYLLQVLDSVERTRLSPQRRREEQSALERLIHVRSCELDCMNPGWHQKISTVLRPDVTSQELDGLAGEAPQEDYFLLRLISEHPRASTRTLARLARHRYTAIRENIARHPNADPKTLTLLSRDRWQPLWYLVAFNPSAPRSLRQMLLRRLRQSSQSKRSK